MASSSSTSSTPITNNFTLPSITQNISTKLEDPNYLNWVSHFMPLLKAHELMGLVDGSEPCPPQYVVDDTGKPTTMVNPDYCLWQKKDQCLLS
jgi:hypothetical protein